MKLQNYRNIKQTVFVLISGFILTPRERKENWLLETRIVCLLTMFWLTYSLAPPPLSWPKLLAFFLFQRFFFFIQQSILKV